MKKKALILAAMLSVLLFSFGTAHAVIGVNDDVPVQYAVMPFICAQDGSMNTLWAIADVWGDGASAFVEVYTWQSVFIVDDVWVWTDDNPDVVSWDCQNMIDAIVPDASLSGLAITIGGKSYYAGYVVVYTWGSYDLVFWQYLVDATKGFASGFSPLQIESVNGFTSYWEEYDYDFDTFVAMPAVYYFPRYLFVNTDKSDTWNWWFFLFPYNDTSRYLVGIICNEDEDCYSVNIQVRYELTILNVKDYLPPILKTGTLWAGFGSFLLCDEYDTSFNVCDDVYADYSTEGWSYQRSQGSSVAASWDVIHKIHRINPWYSVLGPYGG